MVIRLSPSSGYRVRLVVCRYSGLIGVNMKKKNIYGKWHKVRLFLPGDPEEGFYIETGKRFNKAFIKRLNHKEWRLSA